MEGGGWGCWGVGGDGGGGVERGGVESSIGHIVHGDPSEINYSCSLNFFKDTFFLPGMFGIIKHKPLELMLTNPVCKQISV